MALKRPVLPPVFRARDLPGLGMGRSTLRSMQRAGQVEAIGRGLYRRTDAKPTELETVAAVCARAPGAVVCLLTALAMHDIGTQLPPEVWIAIDRKARKPRFDDLPVRIVRFSGAMLTYGVGTRMVEGVSVKVTSPARTVVDCFRYRNKIGLDIALEALRDGLARRLATPDEVVRAAEVCRIQTVVRPYLQATLA
jgi:predicted transcriptional regulator of viral defense system